jgi:hypothetical protein
VLVLDNDMGRAAQFTAADMLGMLTLGRSLDRGRELCHCARFPGAV